VNQTRKGNYVLLRITLTEVQAYCRQTMLGGEYGLLNRTNYHPNPDWFATSVLPLNNSGPPDPCTTSWPYHKPCTTSWSYHKLCATSWSYHKPCTTSWSYHKPCTTSWSYHKPCTTSWSYARCLGLTHTPARCFGPVIRLDFSLTLRTTLPNIEVLLTTSPNIEFLLKALFAPSICFPLLLSQTPCTVP
jgi:hypothetical protein